MKNLPAVIPRPVLKQYATAKKAVLSWRGTQYEAMRPMMGTMTMKYVLIQLTCLCQLLHVMGCSEMCGFFRSYPFDLNGMYSVVPSGMEASTPVDLAGILDSLAVSKPLCYRKED